MSAIKCNFVKLVIFPYYFIASLLMTTLKKSLTSWSTWWIISHKSTWGYISRWTILTTWPMNSFTLHWFELTFHTIIMGNHFKSSSYWIQIKHSIVSISFSIFINSYMACNTWVTGKAKNRYSTGNLRVFNFFFATAHAYNTM